MLGTHSSDNKENDLIDFSNSRSGPLSGEIYERSKEFESDYSIWNDNFIQSGDTLSKMNITLGKAENTLNDLDRLLHFHWLKYIKNKMSFMLIEQALKLIPLLNGKDSDEHHALFFHACNKMMTLQLLKLLWRELQRGSWIRHTMVLDIRKYTHLKTYRKL